MRRPVPASQHPPEESSLLIIIQEHCRELYRELYSSKTLLADAEKLALAGASVISDEALRQRIEKHLARYDFLGALLRFDVSDRFDGTDLDVYLSLLRSVPNIDTSPPTRSLRELLALRAFADRPIETNMISFRLSGSSGEELVLNPAGPDIEKFFGWSHHVCLVAQAGMG